LRIWPFSQPGVASGRLHCGPPAARYMGAQRVDEHGYGGTRTRAAARTWTWVWKWKWPWVRRTVVAFAACQVPAERNPADGQGRGGSVAVFGGCSGGRLAG
jgi:hypothetical protein